MNAVSAQSPRKAAATSRRRRETGGKPAEDGPRVVIGVDGSADSFAALLWAAREACRRGALLHIVSAWQDGGPGPGSARPTEARTAARRLDRALKQVLREEPRPDRIACALAEGEPGKVLLDTARGADLLVLGTAGDGNGRVPGVTGLYCLRHAEIPMALVPGPFRA